MLVRPLNSFRRSKTLCWDTSRDLRKLSNGSSVDPGAFRLSSLTLKLLMLSSFYLLVNFSFSSLFYSSSCLFLLLSNSVSVLSFFSSTCLEYSRDSMFCSSFRFSVYYGAATVSFFSCLASFVLFKVSLDFISSEIIYSLRFFKFFSCCSSFFLASASFFRRNPISSVRAFTRLVNYSLSLPKSLLL